MKSLEEIKQWVEEYRSTGVFEPESAVLSTSDESRPSSRVVLIREINLDGLIFYTNLNSRKSQEIQKNNNVALNFHFRELKKQIRVEGRATQLTDAKADEYFASRTRDKQISAWASKQSEILKDEHEFLDRIKYYEEEFSGKTINRPQFWSGYIVTPMIIEFWEEGVNRRHHRTCYQKTGSSWQEFKLYP